MKKKVVFDKPTDVVGIQDIRDNSFFMAEKEGCRAILTKSGAWLDTEFLSTVHKMSVGAQKGSITKAHLEGYTIYQYDSFHDLCMDYIAYDLNTDNLLKLSNQ